MASTTIIERDGAVAIENTTEVSGSGASWGAIIGGAFIIGSLSVVLLALGTGLGLSSVSPWPYSGASSTTLKAMTIAWLIVVQWLSAGVGGYMTGRLRTGWPGIHPHESYFRDSANGFVAWAVATVLVALLLASGLSSAIGGATRSAATIFGGAAQGATQSAANQAGTGTAGNPSAYFVDTMFRSDTPNASTPDSDVKTETGRIMLQGLKNGDLSAADRTYLAKLVAAKTGLSQDDAQKRVDQTFAQLKDAEMKARQAADEARKVGAQLAIFTALSMMIGAFIAAAAAALGGAHRDEGWGYPPRY
jgi:hypothetical protein